MTSDKEYDELTQKYGRAHKSYHDLFEKLFGLRPVEPGNVPPTVEATDEELQKLDELKKKLDEVHERWFEATNKIKAAKEK